MCTLKGGKKRERQSSFMPSRGFSTSVPGQRRIRHFECVHFKQLFIKEDFPQPPSYWVPRKILSADTIVLHTLWTTGRCLRNIHVYFFSIIKDQRGKGFILVQCGFSIHSQRKMNVPNLTMVDVNRGVSIHWAAISVLAIQVMSLGLIRRVVKVQLRAPCQCSRDYTSYYVAQAQIQEFQ